MIKPIRSGVKKILASLALLSIEIIISTGIFLVALLAFIAVTRMIFFEHKDQFDLYAFEIMARHTNDFNTALMQFFTFLGTHIFLIPANIILVSYFLFIKRHRWFSIKVPVVAISSVLLMYVLKFIFNRPRPLLPLLEAAKGLSFPSGHALNSISFYGLLIYLVWRNFSSQAIRWVLSLLLVGVILMIGLSRVYLRVHYASDVIAGYAVGLMWLLISISVLRRLERYSRKNVAPVIETIPTPEVS